MCSDVKNRLNSEANRIFLNLLDFQGIAILLYTFSFSIDTVSTQYTSRHTLQHAIRRPNLFRRQELVVCADEVTKMVSIRKGDYQEHSFRRSYQWVSS